MIKIAIETRLLINVPSPLVLFFMNFVVPFLYFGWLVYATYKLFSTRKELNYKWVFIILITMIFYYPLYLFNQSLVQSTIVLATSELNDYLGLVSTSVGYASLYWNALRFVLAIEFLIWLGITIFKAIFIPKQYAKKRKR